MTPSDRRRNGPEERGRAAGEYEALVDMVGYLETTGTALAASTDPEKSTWSGGSSRSPVYILDISGGYLYGA